MFCRFNIIKCSTKMAKSDVNVVCYTVLYVGLNAAVMQACVKPQFHVYQAFRSGRLESRAASRTTARTI